MIDLGMSDTNQSDYAKGPKGIAEMTAELKAAIAAGQTNFTKIYAKYPECAKHYSIADTGRNVHRFGRIIGSIIHDDNPTLLEALYVQYGTIVKCDVTDLIASCHRKAAISRSEHNSAEAFDQRAALPFRCRDWVLEHFENPDPRTGRFLVNGRHKDDFFFANEFYALFQPYRTPDSNQDAIAILNAANRRFAKPGGKSENLELAKSLINILKTAYARKNQLIEDAVIDLLLTHASPKEIGTELIAAYSYPFHSSIDDFMHDTDYLNTVHTKLIAPAIIAAADRSDDLAFCQKILESKSITKLYLARETYRRIREAAEKMQQLPDDATREQKLEAFQQIQNAFRWYDHLSHTSHSPAGVIPDTLTPLAHNREWHKIFPANMTSKDTYGKIYYWKELDTSKLLAEESDVLKHCVGTHGYDTVCAEPGAHSSMHILSQRDADGNILATLDIRIVDAGYAIKADAYKKKPLSVPLPGTDKTLYVYQHEGQRGNYANSSSGILGNFHDAKLDLLRQIESGAVPVNLKRIGSTTPELQPLATIGYVPTWENVQTMFQEFKRHERRGSEDNHYVRGAQIENWRNIEHEAGAAWRTKVEKPQREACHLIDGTANDHPLASLHVKDWLLQSGLLNALVYPDHAANCLVQKHVFQSPDAQAYLEHAYRKNTKLLEDMAPRPTLKRIARAEAAADARTLERPTENGYGQFVRNPIGEVTQRG